ncbi:MAG: SpoIIE family protein phosphatase [Bacteroidia bacterium]|nr:SpoIIE family protein phosphatase [Bacteroidia bacterium]
MAGIQVSFSQVSFLKNYSIDEGLSHSQVNSLFQDSKGYIWVTTFGGGISRFDGRTFRNFGEADGVSGNITRGTAEDSRGRIWFGSLGGGVFMYDGKRITNWYDSLLPSSKRVYSLDIDKKDQLWLATDSGIYMYDGKRTRYFGPDKHIDAIPFMHIHADDQGRIWASSWAGGVYMIDGETTYRVQRSDGLTSDTIMYTVITAEGKIFSATAHGVSELWMESGKLRAKKVPMNPVLDQQFINCLFWDPREGLWVGTNQQGLVLIRKNGQLMNKKTMHGLQTNNVYHLIVDRENNLWMSLWGFGITRYRGDAIVNFGKESGLEDLLVNAVTRKSDGSFWAGTSGGLLQFDSVAKKFVRDERFPEKNYRVFTRPDGQLTIYAGTTLIEEHPGKTVEWNKKNGMNTANVKYFLQDRDGFYWASSWGHGAGKFREGIYEGFLPENGFCCDYLNGIYIDSKNNKWFGTWDHGLCGIMSDGKIRNIRKSDSLPNDYVNCVAEDALGRLWIGTYGSGLSVYDGKQFITVDHRHGLVHDVIVFIVVSGDYAWVGTTKGLSRVRISDVGKAEMPEIKNFGKAEGLNDIDCLPASGYADPDGRIWFSNKKNLVCLDPVSLNNNPLAVTPLLTSLQLFFENQNWDSLGFRVGPENDLPIEPVFAYYQNHLTFSFTGICMSAPEKVRFKHMLEGAEEKWSPESESGTITYSGLKPGHYTLHIIASNNEGIWTPDPLVYSFTISAPYYQTAWFYLCIAALLGAGAGALFRYRTQKLERDKRALEEKVTERTAEVVRQKEIIEEKNKDITDSINYAARIQEAILPAREEKYRLFPHTFIFLHPRDIVSGDFYWFAQLGQKRLIAAVDCTGHGVPGAFMSMIGNAFLNEIVLEKKITDPGDILNELRKMVVKSLKQTGAAGENRDGMDMAILCFDDVMQEVHFAGANNPCWIVRAGTASLEEVKGDKHPIGSYKGENIPFRTKRLDVRDGDLLYIFTDGYADQFGGSAKQGGKKFKYNRLKELLLSLRMQPMDRQEESLRSHLKEWMGDLEQVDDILIIGIKLAGTAHI